MKIKTIIIILLIALILGFVSGWLLRSPSEKKVPVYVEVDRISIDTAYIEVPSKPIYLRGKGKVDFSAAVGDVHTSTTMNDVITSDAGSCTFTVNIFDGFKIKHQILNESEIYRYILSKPFASVLDTIIGGDTLRLAYKFPVNEFEFFKHSVPDSIMKVNVKERVFIERPILWYDQTWCRVASHIAAVLLTYMVVRR